MAAEIGVPTRPDRPLDGVNLVPYLEGKKTGDPQPVLFWRKFDQGQRALVVGDLKYIDNGQGKLMFNLRADNSERTNIAAANAKNVEQLDRVWSISASDTPSSAVLMAPARVIIILPPSSICVS